MSSLLSDRFLTLTFSILLILQFLKIRHSKQSLCVQNCLLSKAQLAPPRHPAEKQLHAQDISVYVHLFFPHGSSVSDERDTSTILWMKSALLDNLKTSSDKQAGCSRFAALLCVFPLRAVPSKLRSLLSLSRSLCTCSLKHMDPFN